MSKGFVEDLADYAGLEIHAIRMISVPPGKVLAKPGFFDKKNLEWTYDDCEFGKTDFLNALEGSYQWTETKKGIVFAPLNQDGVIQRRVAGFALLKKGDYELKSGQKVGYDFAKKLMLCDREMTLDEFIKEFPEETELVKIINRE